MLFSFTSKRFFLENKMGGGQRDSSAYKSMYFMWSLNNWGGGCLLLRLCCLSLDSFPLAGLPYLATVGKDALSPDGIWCASAGWYLGWREREKEGGAIKM